MLLDLPAIDSYISSAVKVVTKCLGEFWKSSGSNLTRTSAAPLSYSSTAFRLNLGLERQILRRVFGLNTQMRFKASIKQITLRTSILVHFLLPFHDESFDFCYRSYLS